MSETEDVNVVWNGFWAPIVTKGDQFDVEAVKAELYDYWVLLQEVPQVYGHITDGQLTKPNTAAIHIITAHDEAVTKAYDEGRRDGQEDVASVTRIHGGPQ